MVSELAVFDDFVEAGLVDSMASLMLGSIGEVGAILSITSLISVRSESK